MAAETTTVPQGVLRRWVMSAVLVSLAAGLCSLAPASQAALAESGAVSSISAGGEHVCAIVSGKGYCWGENYSGELGDGTNINSGLPMPVDTSGVLAGKTLTRITTGYQNTCALDSTGTAYCWGLNAYGQFGNGSTRSSNVPVAVEMSGALAGKTLTQITTGVVNTCALDTAGVAYCWGWNAYGELGDGSTISSTVPVAVDMSEALAGKTLSQITVGGYHTCVTDALGLAYCWGWNAFGQLGDGSTTSSSVPVAVDAGGVLARTPLSEIPASRNHTCAVGTTGIAYCWGLNSVGQLGNRSTTASSVPVAVDTRGVLAGKAVTRITVGTFDTCAVNSAGASYCWGYNNFGQLGDASTTASSIPVAVDTGGALAGKAVIQITAGLWNTCALDATGGVYCWGRNGSGELGDDGTGTKSTVPVLVGL
jgi:alpha-tubulin suppressor-like RCC1 family protein